MKNNKENYKYIKTNYLTKFDFAKIKLFQISCKKKACLFNTKRREQKKMMKKMKEGIHE